MIDLDYQIRMMAFEWLQEQVNLYGEVLPRELLRIGFECDGNRIPLVSPQGIFTPKVMKLPLTITTSPKGPYDDQLEEGDIVSYKYRGDDPNHRDNIGLRELMKQNIPLIYLFGITPGKYVPAWPVYIIDDNPSDLAFAVAIDDARVLSDEYNYEGDVVAEGRRKYIITQVKQRLHQHTFCERVLEAYKTQCAICRLKHRELLKASHIIPDSEPEGKPIVPNGLSLCGLHHDAFDKYLIGITPDYTVEIRQDILDEEDGPMLEHGLQGIHNSKIYIPRKKENKPNKDFLDWRYQKFREVI